MMLDDSDAIAPTKRIILKNGRLLQVGALVYRFDEQTKACQILLITSRGSGRWVIPKGWPMPGRTLAQAALREAYEEAGIRGQVDELSCGHYHYKKKDILPPENNRFHVEIFAVAYQGQKKKWPEQGQRQLEWMSTNDAAAQVQEPDLKRILRQFVPQQAPKLN